MTEENTDAAILIAGGYHTAHLTQLWREEGTSYIVLTPLVTDRTDQQKYEEILLQHLRDQEKKLSRRTQDTAPYQAQNVAPTKIPRGLRQLEAAARLANLPPAAAAFVTARLGKATLNQIQSTATRLAGERLEQKWPKPTRSAARMAKNRPEDNRKIVQAKYRSDDRIILRRVGFGVGTIRSLDADAIGIEFDLRPGEIEILSLERIVNDLSLESNGPEAVESKSKPINFIKIQEATRETSSSLMATIVKLLRSFLSRKADPEGL